MTDNDTSTAAATTTTHLFIQKTINFQDLMAKSLQEEEDEVDKHNLT